MQVTKEMLTGMGISEKDADIILSQANGDKVVSKSEVEEVVKEPTVADITTISQLSEYSKGQIVKLPDFAPGHPFVARLKRPSIFAMVRAGKIPNSLLNSVSGLFGDDKGSKEALKMDTPTKMSNMMDLMEVIAEAALVSPTYDEIKGAGLSLTDEQMTAIFNYTQEGIEDLKSFR